MQEVVKEDRPEILGGLVIKVKTGCGNMYVQLTWCHGHLFEVFANLGKSGGCASCQTQAVTRLITSALRSGMPISECTDQIRGLQCPSPIMFPKSQRCLSCMDAVANTMTKLGKLSVCKVIEYIMQSNDMVEVVEHEKELDDKGVEEAVKSLEEQRKKDGLYENEDNSVD